MHLLQATHIQQLVEGTHIEEVLEATQLRSTPRYDGMLYLSECCGPGLCDTLFPFFFNFFFRPISQAACMQRRRHWSMIKRALAMSARTVPCAETHTQPLYLVLAHARACVSVCSVVLRLVCSSKNS